MIKSGKIGLGAEVSISTAKSPVLRTALTDASCERTSEPSPRARSSENTTSSAVKGAPS